MKQQDKDELEKVIDSNIYKENGKFICKFCSMTGNTADEAKMHPINEPPFVLKICPNLQTDPTDCYPALDRYQI